MEDTKLERLLEHPRTARLSLSPLDGGGEEGRENHYHGRTFVYRTCEGGGQDIRLQGLTNRLRQRFYPDYRAPQKKHGHGSSTAAGSAVHRQLEHLVNCKRDLVSLPRPSLTCRSFCRIALGTGSSVGQVWYRSSTFLI
jgi:hypothetical protein